MAKAGLILQGARGKLGKMKLSKGEGTTIISELVAPGNPQTQKQMAQRIIFGTVAQARTAMKAIVNHSFQGISSEKKNLREFTRLNIRQLRNLAAQDYAGNVTGGEGSMFVTTKGISMCIPNQYVIANGSLSAPKINVMRNAQGELVPCFANEGVVLPVVENKVKLGDLIQWLFGIQNKMEMITLCVIARNADGFVYSYNDYDMAGCQIPYTAFNARRIVVNSSVDFNAEITVAGDGITLETVIENAIKQAFSSTKTNTQFLNLVAGMAVDAISLQNNALHIDNASIDTSEWVSLYAYKANNACNIYAAGFIRSQKDGKNWKRSKSVMKIAEPIQQDDANYGLYWAIANDAWFEGSEIADTSEFLNEGGTSNTVGETF